MRPSTLPTSRSWWPISMPRGWRIFIICSGWWRGSAAGRPSWSSLRSRVVVLTTDSEFEQSVRTTFGSSGDIDLTVAPGGVVDHATLDLADISVVVADLDATRLEDFHNLQRLVARLGGRSSVVVVTQ